MRASTPSETTSSCVVGEERRDLRLVGLELVGTPSRSSRSRRRRSSARSRASGRPLTKSTTSGRRLCWPSTTVNWLTASQSLLSGSSKSITRACAPAIEPSARRYSTVTPSTSIRWTARLRSIERRRLGPRELAEGVVERLGRQVRVEPGERLAQAPLQDHVAVGGIAALGAGLADGDVRAVGSRVAQRIEPSQTGQLHVHFSELA